jgi:hypothetical protein
MKILLELAPHELTDSWVALIRATKTVELPPVEEQKKVVESKAKIVNELPKKTWTTSPESVKAVDAGTGTICGSPTPEDTPPEIPKGNPAITIDEIKVAAANLLATGGVQKKDLQELNSMFNIKSLMELKPEQFNDYCMTLRGMGAVI